MKTTFKTILLIALISFFTGCGGGGGSSDPTPPPDPDTVDFGAGAVITTFNIPSPDSFDDAKDAIEATPAGNYILNITSDIDVGSAGILPAADANISLRGGGTIHKSSGTNANLFNLNNAGSKLVLRNATLKGHSGNNVPLVRVNSSTASFVMLGGEIKDNNSDNYGGGVGVYNGSFTMNGGTISGNTGYYGGGVFVNAFFGGTFNKTGGTIYGKTPEGLPYWNQESSGDAKGHAVFVSASGGDKKRNTTAGETVGLNSSTSDNWEP